MALVLKRLGTGYFWLFSEMSDPRIEDSFLLSSPLVPLGILAAFLYFVFIAGPKFMENRKPFQMKTILTLYNLSQIVFNVIFIFHGVKTLSYMNFHCNPVDYSYSPKGKLLLDLSYFFYLLKLYDLVDTIFMVLKRNTRQVTFLHVYHHCGMVIGCFVAAKFIPGGELFWTGFLNVIIHSIMYSYYLMSTLDSKWKRHLAMKKFLTQLQLVQFAANILIYGRLLFIKQCSFPRFVSYAYVPQNIFMLALFGDFYIKTYILKSSKH